MGILIGMDEAGYGPNLGPLVVAASAWEVVEEKGSGFGVRGSGLKAEGNSSTSVAPVKGAALSRCDLYRLLRRVVVKGASDSHVAIADSKALYKPGLGLRQLERGVHAVLGATGQGQSQLARHGIEGKGIAAAGGSAASGSAARMAGLCGCWAELVGCCDADRAGHHQALCWHEGFNCALPVDATCGEVAELGPRMRAACDGAGVRPLVVRARLVYPAEFNTLCEKFGSKGAALSHVTIGLLREVVEGVQISGAEDGPAREVFAVCDKHGGRNFYAGLLQHHFPEHWIRSVQESRAESRYEWGGDEARTEVVFRTKGEEFLPTALASMTAKYLRELSMRAFNEFWCARVPGLRPTAGYPGDARRFKAAIEGVQRELRVEDRVLWRDR
jgi:hypothetical protein